MFFNPSTLIAVFSIASAVPALAEPSQLSSLPSIRRSLASKLDRRAQKLARQNNAQTSRTLDPSQVAPGLAQDGQAGGGDPGQVPSLTSTNNFINFCLTQNVPLTNGQQVKSGSCNAVPMGRIIASTRMPSSKFVNPKNGDTIAANTAFTIQMAIVNMVTGNFVNPQTNYYSAPQQVDGSGTVIGHSHVTVEALTSLGQTTVTDPQKFVFFKGLNEAAQGGVLSAAVTAGLPAGAYRMCSINSAANHQPVLVAVAQRGSTDDCVYFTAGGNGGGNAGNGGNGGNNGGNNNAGNGAGNNAAVPATSSSRAAATATPATGNNRGNTGNTGGGRNNAGNGGGRNRFGGGSGRTSGNTGAGNNAAPILASVVPSSTSSAPTSNATPATGNTGGNNGNAGAGNLQKFTGTLGGAAPAVAPGGRGFVVNGDSFLNQSAALQRSCDVQKNTCANTANSSGNKAPVTVAACEAQQQACTAAISA